MPVNRLIIEAAILSSPHHSNPVDVSGINGDCTVKLRLNSFLQWDSARVTLEESPDGFVTARTLAVWNFLAGVLPTEGVVVSWRKREACGTDLFGTAGAEVRVNVVELYGSSPAFNYSAWIEF